MKKFFIIFFLFIFIICPSYADNIMANMLSEFNITDNHKQVQFILQEEISADDFIIPANTIITADIYHSKKEGRWHKSGYFICKLKELTDEDKIIDISDKEIFLTARKYESVNGKDAAVVGTELTLSTAVAIFLPGVDILYFFTKGAIQRQKHPNWFRAGVSNAYDNSIFWFFLKGKDIELTEGDIIKLKEVKKKKIKKIKKKYKEVL